MINIISKYNDDTSLEVLATKCNYEVIIYKNDDGSVTSALCRGENAGEEVRNTIDTYKLLKFDNPYIFPETYRLVNFKNNLNL